MPAILHHTVPDRPDRRGTRASSRARSHRCGWVMFGPFEPGCNWNAVPATWPLFNLAIDSKLRGCDLVALRVDDVAPNGYAVDRATVRQRKTGRPVRFELTDVTRQAVDDYLRESGLTSGQSLFPGHFGPDLPLTTRQYARLVSQWVRDIGLDPLKYATHSMRRTKATLIYRRTGNLRAVQLLLEHQKIESTVRYLGVEVDDALEIAEKIEV